MEYGGWRVLGAFLDPSKKGRVRARNIVGLIVSY
jgi:hypothetical protein